MGIAPIDRVAVLFALGLATVSVLPRPTRAQTPVQWVVSPTDVSLACLGARNARNPEDSVPPILKQFCNLGLGSWAEWTSDAFPTGDMIVHWALLGREVAAEATRQLDQSVTLSTRSSAPASQPAARVAPSSQPALTETALLIGLTDFLVERTEAEIQTWLLPLVYRRLCYPRYKTYQHKFGSLIGGRSFADSVEISLALIFAETCNLFQNSAEVGLATAGRSIRAALLTDLRNAPGAVLLSAATLLQAVPPKLDLLAGDIRTHAKTLGGDRTADTSAAAAFEARARRLRAHYESIKDLLPLASVIERTIRDGARNPSSPAVAVAGIVEIAETIDDPGFRQTDLYVTAVLIRDVMHTLESDVLPRSMRDWVDALRAYLTNLHNNTRPASPELRDALSLGSGNEIEISKVAAHFDRLTEVHRHLAAAQDAYENLRAEGPRVELYVTLLRHIRDAVEAAIGKQLDGRTADVIAGTARIVVAAQSGDFAGGVAGLAPLLKALELDSIWDPNIIRILTFAADVAQSTTSTEVKDAIEAFASAAGARKPKRADGHEWLVGVQAYGGLQGGREGVKLDGGSTANAGFGGLYFPVGVEVTFPDSKFGVFLQIIDVGVIASRRLGGGDSVDEEPEIGFGQVIAPGAYFTWAVRRTPMSVGLGVSAAPKLRSFSVEDSAGNTVKQRGTALRMGVFFAVDIRLFP